jgi:hypothetical protein
MLLRGGAVAAILLAAADWTRAQGVTGGQATVTTEEVATPGWIFAPSIGVGAFHDSNVLLLAVPDDPPRDSGMPVRPHARLDYGGRRTNFGAGYDGSFLLYQDLRELNSSDHQVGAHFSHRLSRRATLFGQENLTHASTTAGLMISGVPFYRLGSVSNAIAGGVDVLLSRRTTLHSSYSHDLVSFDSFVRLPATPPLAGGYSHDVTASLSQAISPTVTIGGDYEITRAVLADGEDRFFIHTTTMTVAFHASRQVVLSGFAGICHVTASATQDPRTGPALRAAVTRRDRRTLLIASYERTFLPSYGFGGTFSNQEWRGVLRVPFGRNRAYVEGSLTRFDNQPIEPTQDKLRSLYAGGLLGYRATRWANVEAFYRRSEQNLRGQLRRDEFGVQVVAATSLRLR